jgi:hypothetical protein
MSHHTEKPLEDENVLSRHNANAQDDNVDDDEQYDSIQTLNRKKEKSAPPPSTDDFPDGGFRAWLIVFGVRHAKTRILYLLCLPGPRVLALLSQRMLCSFNC